MSIVDEFIDVWNFDPLTMIEVKSFIIPVVIIAAVVIGFWLMSMHGHVFSMGSEAIPFSSGHPANGDASIFGSDGFHFRNE